MTKHKGKAQINVARAIGYAVKANIMAYVVTSIFILFSSILLTYTSMGPGFEGIIVCLGVAASAFLAGFDTAKIDEHNGYKWGMIGGLVYFGIFLTLGILLQKLDHTAPGMIFLMAVSILLVSGIAGMISVNCVPHSKGKRY